MSEVVLDEKMQKAVKRLIDAGTIKGCLTYDEVGEKLAVECEASAEQMDEVLRILEENKIKVVRDERPKVELSDKINREIKRLIEVGKRRGHLTYDEVGESWPWSAKPMRTRWKRFSIFSPTTA